LLSDERGVPALSGHKQSTNWTGRLLMARRFTQGVPPSYAPLCQMVHAKQGLYIAAACQALWVLAQC
jgi:hypothetical protein